MSDKTAVRSTRTTLTYGARKVRLLRWFRKNLMGYCFLLPFLVLFLVFTVFPVGVSMGTSLTNYNMIQKPSFIGLTNYKLLFLEDDVFMTAIKNTLVFALLIGPLGYFMSFLMAWIISLMKRGRGLLALAFYAPSLTSGTAMSVIWMVIFSGDRTGYLNHLLLNIGLIQEPILWTKDAGWIMFVVVFISAWMSMGSGFLVFLAGLQNVDPELYESGKVDGIKSPFQQLFYITLPLLKPQLLFGAINSIVSSFAVFDVVTAVAGFPSPNYSAHTLVAHLYDYAFTRFNMGYASAVAMFLFVLTFSMGRVCMKIFKSDD